MRPRTDGTRGDVAPSHLKWKQMTRDEFSDLVLSYLGEVTAYARRLTRTKWDADDLVQNTFERAFRKRRDLREPGQCRAWLFRIARNLYIDRYRAHAARPELRIVKSTDRLAPEPFVNPETVEQLTAQDLDAALARLPEDQREAVLLCDLWGFRYDEISEIEDVPIGTVRSRIARGRAALSHDLHASEQLSSKGGRR